MSYLNDVGEHHVNKNTQDSISSEAVQYYQQAILNAHAVWRNAQSADSTHPVLKTHNLLPLATRVSAKGVLLVPVFRPGACLQSIQGIASTGERDFFPGTSPKHGCYQIGLHTGYEPLAFAQSFEDAAIIHLCTHLATVCYFTRDNLLETAMYKRAKCTSAFLFFVHAGARRQAINDACKVGNARIITPIFEPYHVGKSFSDAVRLYGYDVIPQLLAGVREVRYV